nr:sulfatase-like hydrolase/transferase [uncultured Algibacter sp.]
MGLLKVGLPGSEQGLNKKDVTLASLLKDKGYKTGQFGKNHLGDLDKRLPTVHGFDEFFGILYHLNAMEEPEEPNYPKDPAFRKKFGPRNVLHTCATGKETQKIEDEGPLTKKRMETFDEETLEHAITFMDKALKEDKPFFTWFNTTRMHNYTHLSPEYDGKTKLGLGVYADGMTHHDVVIGQVLDYLDKNNIVDNTIVVYTTDNGVQYVAWPDGGSTPFRGEKGTCFEGGQMESLVAKLLMVYFHLKIGCLLYLPQLVMIM